MVAPVRSALILFGNLFRFLLLPLWLAQRVLARPRARFVQVKIAASPVELSRPLSLLERVARKREPSAGQLSSIDALWTLVRAIANDSSAEGMLVILPHLTAGWASCASLRAPIAWLKARGKQVIVYLPLGGSQRELYVASAGSRIVAPPSATLWVLGAAAQAMYFKPLLDRVGVSTEVFATGDYKTAAEPFTRESMSSAQEEQLGALAKTIQREIERGLSERPGMDEARIKACFDRGFFRGAEAIAAGLLDACRYEDELLLELGPPPADLKKPKTIGWARYLAYRGARVWRPLRPRAAIGVVAVHGAITDTAPRVALRSGASFEPVARALRAARRDRSLRAVILHIDSPGGSALASDLIHRELMRLREKKPVIACMANVAASGGYYVAVACQRIVAQPTTTTGSIGVISARILLAEVAERIGVRPQTVRAAPHADMMSPFRVLQDDERAMLLHQVKDFYGAFLAVVAQGRGRTPDQIDELARGRVWSGTDAHDRGLIDTLGGLERAVEEIVVLTPALQGIERSEIALRFIKGEGDIAPADPSADGAPPKAAQLAELVTLFTNEAVLYYAPTPKLGV